RVRRVLSELDDDAPPVRPVGVVLLGVGVLAQARRRGPPRLQDRTAQRGRPEDVVRHSCGSSGAASAAGSPAPAGAGCPAAPSVAVAPSPTDPASARPPAGR